MGRWMRWVGFYRGRATAESLIKEANNDAGLTAHPSKRWMMNANWFQIVMLAYNLNFWLMLFHREESEKVDEMRHTTLATARLRFLFLAAKIWRHAGRVGVSYSDHYEEKGVFDPLMARLRARQWKLKPNDMRPYRKLSLRRPARQVVRLTVA